MKTLTIPVINKSNNNIPQYESTGAAGLDVRVDLSKVTPDFTLKGYGDTEVIWVGEGHSVPMVRMAPGARVLFPTGIYTAIPEGWQVSLRPRSGLSIKQGITLVNTPSTIDADYRGEWHIPLINLGHEDVFIEDGERVCQAILEPVYRIQWKETDKLNETERGTGGFGSSGVR